MEEQASPSMCYNLSILQKVLAATSMGELKDHMPNHSALLRLHALSFLTVEFWDRVCLPRLFNVALSEPSKNLVPN